MQAEWFSHTIYDVIHPVIHPDDVQKVTEHLSLSEPVNTGRILDLKSMYRVYTLYNCIDYRVYVYIVYVYSMCVYSIC